MIDYDFNQYRLLLCYKGHISALVMFGQQQNGSVCFPKPLPRLSVAMPEDENQPNKIILHPATLLKAVNQILQFDQDLLTVEPGYTEQVDAPGGIITVYMASFNLLDPPHQLLASRDCFLKTLPELRNSPPAELELLRRAYVKMMEG